MLTLKKSYIDGDLWYAVFNDDIFFCAWYSEDLPSKFKFLLEKKDACIRL